MTQLLLCALLFSASQPAADESLTSPGARAPRRVDASQRELFALQWRRPIVRTGFTRRVNVSFGSPAVSVEHGLVVVGTGEGYVLGLSLRDGTELWRYQHGAPFEGTATLVTVPADGKEPPLDLVVVGSRDGTLLALEPHRGKLVWQAAVEGDVRAAAAAAGDLVLVTTAQNRLLAIEGRSGKIRWRGGRPAPTGLTVVGHARPLVAAGSVYAAFSDGYVEAYALADGTRRWSRPTSMHGGEFGDADADPLLVGGRLFVASYSDGIYALNPDDGQTLWSRAAPAVRSLAAYGDKLLAGSGDGFVWGLGQADGEPLHRTRLERGLVSQMTVRDEMVLFAAGDSGLVALDARNGRPLQATSVGTRAAADLVWREDAVALVTSDGQLFAFARGPSALVR